MLTPTGYQSCCSSTESPDAAGGDGHCRQPVLRHWSQRKKGWSTGSPAQKTETRHGGRTAKSTFHVFFIYINYLEEISRVRTQPGFFPEILAIQLWGFQPVLYYRKLGENVELFFFFKVAYFRMVSPTEICKAVSS